jgi:hypothetical protein
MAQQPEITDADISKIAAQLDAERYGMDAPSEVEQPDATTGQDEVKKPEGSENPEDNQDQAEEPGKEPAEESDKEETQAEIDYRAEYERLKKEQERKDRSWQKLNEEKEALAKLKATTRVNETRVSDDQFSAEDYEQYAEKLVNEGDGDGARKAMTRAKEIRQKAFVEQFQQTVNEAIEEEPELADRESDIAKAVQSLLNDPSFGGVPRGFKNAVRLAKAEKMVGSIPGLKAEIDKLNKEIQRQNSLLEVGGGNKAHKRTTEKRFEDMDLKEAGEYIRRKGREADEAYFS